MENQELKQFSEEMRRHFDVVAEDLTSKIQLIALRDMVVKNTEYIEIMRAKMLEKRVLTLESKGIK